GELVRVQAELAGVLVEVLAVEVPRVREELVVQLPKLALRLRGQRGFGGQVCIGVKRQRSMAEVKAQIAQVFFEELIEGGRAASAERTLKIREFDDRNRCFDRALRRADERNPLP